MINWDLSAKGRQELQPMSASSNCFTLVLPSPQAASLSAWLQKCNLAMSEGASADLLIALAVQLDDARWLGRWLREETRMAIACTDAAAICQALIAAMPLAAPSDQEEAALKRLIAELETGSAVQSPQLACPASPAIVTVNSRS